MSWGWGEAGGGKLLREVRAKEAETGGPRVSLGFLRVSRVSPQK
jgi:hypothetical protein